MSKKSRPSLRSIPAVQAMRPDTGESHESHSRSTRRIENGYVTRETSAVNGEWRESERFHESPHDPKTGSRQGSCGDQGGALSRAKDYLARD